ncbi:MAG: hypothetical protein JNJ65_13530 [Cyclobacteriaceae bacterium]|nr:hypothetical protein [Cyclobacteriaceae bacterium]
MSTPIAEATQEEIAEIIFNSIDPELNDMLQKAKSNNYEINYIIGKITVDINVHYLHHLITNSDSANSRKAFLFDKIKSELDYYTKQ